MDYKESGYAEVLHTRFFTIPFYGIIPNCTFFEFGWAIVVSKFETQSYDDYYVPTGVFT